MKASRRKAKSEGSKKTSVATAAIEDEGEIILVAANHDIKDAYTCVPIKEETDYIFLDDRIDSNKEVESEENTDFDIHDLLSVEEVAAEVWKKVAPKSQSKLQTMEMYKSSVDVDLQHSDEDEIQGGDVSLVVMSETTLQPTMEALVDKNMWIADTGATSHVTNSKVGGKNHCNLTVKTREFVGESINPDLEMDIPVTYMCENGDEIEAELQDVQVNKMFNFNLFSVTRMLQRGYKLKGDAKSMSLEKGNHKFVFVSVICTRGGALYCARFQRNENPPPQEYDVASVVSNADTSAVTKKIFKINIKHAHEYLGHLSEDTTRLTAKYLGMNLLHGLLPVCKSCAIAKAKQRNVPKETSGGSKAKEFNGRVFHDLSKIRAPDELGEIKIAKSNWHILIDKATGFKRSRFFITKGGIIQDMCEYMYGEKERGYTIKILRQDNAKENVGMIKMAKGKDWKLTFLVELTARNTPQQNSKAEMAFTVIAAQARSMLIAAQFLNKERFKLWPEVVITVMFLNNLVPVILNGETKTRWEHACHKLSLWVTNLQTFGEAGTTKEGKKGKVLDRGVTMMFVGYNNYHSGKCYHMYNPVTSRVVIT